MKMNLELPVWMVKEITKDNPEASTQALIKAALRAYLNGDVQTVTNNYKTRSQA